MQLQRVCAEAVKINLTDIELITAFNESIYSSELKADLIRNLSTSNMTFPQFRSEVLRRSQAILDIAKLSNKTTTNVIDLNAANFKGRRTYTPKQQTCHYKSYKPRFTPSHNSHLKRDSHSAQECKRCGQKGHYSADCQAEAPIGASSRCLCCGSVLHQSSNCPRDRSSLVCNRCNGAGHLSTICVKKLTGAPRPSAAPKVRFDNSKNTRQNYDANELEVTNHSVEVNNVNLDDTLKPTKTINLYFDDIFACSALIDSGADMSMISPKLIERLHNEFENVEITPIPGKVTVRVADDRKISHCSRINLRICLSKGSKIFRV